jgi:hypothetical protein
LEKPLERMYPVASFDALRVKILDDATVRSKAILGLWIQQTEGAKFLDESVQRLALDTFERGPGPDIPDGRRDVAPRLDAHHPVLCRSAGHPPADRHDEFAGERPRAALEDHQNARTVSH